MRADGVHAQWDGANGVASLGPSGGGGMWLEIILGTASVLTPPLFTPFFPPDLVLAAAIYLNGNPAV